VSGRHGTSFGEGVQQVPCVGPEAISHDDLLGSAI
jgi:hypothetical protein